MDFTPITDAIVLTGVTTAIIAMGALKASPNLARWVSNKLASFFR